MSWPPLLEVGAYRGAALQFPWLRALPGLLAMIAALAVAKWHGVGTLNEPAAVQVRR